MSVLKINLHAYRHRHRHHQLSLQPPMPHFPFRISGEQTVKPSPIVGLLYSSTKYVKHSNINAAAPFSIGTNKDEKDIEDFEEYLAEDGEVYQKTLRLVECAMFAAVSALAFLLSNSLAIEKYFACFFALPIVLSTMRWGVAAGRKTMVATTVLLFVLSGPVKAITYLLLHGFLGFSMGTLWRSKANWRTSISLCAIVRAIGALANVVIASYLIGENILALITINVHALVTYILSSIGIIAVPSMNLIYSIFGFLLLLNCGFFVFLLHLLYAIFFTRLGLKASLRLPKWLEAAI
ncbi:uncharacterized protein LOC130986298 isoform X1 [Salvia miltiorrhiza]|uniref:uncharacterized protein LOC130986298 isoform X1 n=1 Tax=Salvia miltiorrhiza TaxID=226208 RepID=UPI0025ABF2C7|nr:uncharacterized protein LOC130986298 isoform X1 [Salvia miltiorrhiza]XP_057765655.1 uncharacterized protein LOC130986298 isoform X1 [Salvia miltiorrhiza]